MHTVYFFTGISQFFFWKYLVKYWGSVAVGLLILNNLKVTECRELFVLLFQTTSQKTSQKETDFREAHKTQTGAKTQAEGLATTQKSPQKAEAGWGGERGRGQGAVPCSRGRGGGGGGGADGHTGHAEGTGEDPLLPWPCLQELLPHGEEHLPGRFPFLPALECL